MWCYSLVITEEVYEKILSKLSNEERVIIQQQQQIQQLQLQMELEILKVKYKNIKKDLANANWDKLSKSSLIDLRSFLDIFDRNKLDQEIFERNKSFRAFAKEKEKDLKKSNLTLKSFNKAFQNLYNKVSASAHPLFTSKDILVIKKENLDHHELQILGFLWDKFPLPRGRLHVKYSNNELYDVFKKYRK